MTPRLMTSDLAFVLLLLVVMLLSLCRQGRGGEEAPAPLPNPSHRHYYWSSSTSSDSTDADHPPCPAPCNCSMTSLAAARGAQQQQQAVEVGEEGLLFTVNCTNRGLKNFPPDTPNSTQVLLFAHNQMRNLSSLPPLPHLRLLDLSHNEIGFLDNHWVFEHMELLKELNLCGNSLKVLQHGSFSGLKSLEVLQLCDNNIKTIELHAFGGLNHLSILHLGHNNLYELKRPWLLAMTSLRELHVRDNHISVIEERTFDKHTSLLHLDISDNGLKRVADSGFVGLSKVRFLNLSENDLVTIPTVELQRLVNLEILLLDGIKVKGLTSGDFSDMSVSSLSLSFLPNLQVVKHGAFSNLTHLRTLQLHDNPNLIFIHPWAFQGTPLLHKVFLHNNKLITLSSHVRDSLPRLDELHLYHNRLHCDCNILWLKRDLLHFRLSQQDGPVADGNETTQGEGGGGGGGGYPDTGYIKEANLLMCNTPTTSTDMQLMQVPLNLLPPVCAPTTLPFFSDVTNVSLGDDLTLECQAIGVPDPVISWLLPGGRETTTDTSTTVSLTSKAGGGANVTVSSPVAATISTDNTVLTVRGVQPSDHGTYVCRATSEVGYDTSSTLVNVLNKELRLTVEDVANNYITVAWVGSIPIQHMSDFQIFYRKSGDSDREYDKVYLHGSMHKCRLAGLLPMTSYEICIMYRETYSVQCRNFSTDHKVALVHPSGGITRVNLAGIVASMCSVVGVLIVLCMVRVVMRRVRKRKDYKDPLCRDGGGEMDKISLEPINSQTPGTPLCSSRTALLPHSQI